MNGIRPINMIAQCAFFIAGLLLFQGHYYPAFAQSAAPGAKRVEVKRVVDGDTLELSDGQRVRLLGVDTPEKGEPMAEAAADVLRERVGRGQVGLSTCRETDKYGRLLSVVFVEGVNANLGLLEEGMALPLLIPPCGAAVSGSVLESAARAARKGLGLFSGIVYPVVSHLDAEPLVGKEAMVRGRILGLHKGPRAWHLNFGEDYRTDFTAVLFPEGQERFRQFGLDPAALVGSEVLVIGRVKQYNGPEIIVRGPDQVLVLE